MNAASAYNLLRETRDRVFSLAMRSSFASLGARSRLSLPVQLVGSKRITIGSRVYFGPGCWLLTHEPEGRLEVGDDTSIAGYCVLSAAVSVRIGRSVLFARNVYIADHRHGFELEDVPIIDQPLQDIRPVVVEDGAWLGQNVVLLPGVTVGRGAVIGANSVIREDVPPRSVVAGAPGRLVRRLSEH
ncbi:MAG TPA: acyltransferase [Solirubrobacteraceae bacterium]|nr:acyltransferase [Solirubrobacteraceae bacterium]